MGEGQMFKGKLIGVLEVQEARGDRMCQDALQELKTAIKASGEHKQKILIHIAVDGLKIRDEKTGVRLTKHSLFYLLTLVILCRIAFTIIPFTRSVLLLRTCQIVVLLAIFMALLKMDTDSLELKQKKLQDR